MRMPDTTLILSGETEDDFLNDPRPFVEGGDTFAWARRFWSASRRSPPAQRADWLQRHLEPEGLPGAPRAADAGVATSRSHVRRHPRGAVHVLHARTKDGRLPAPIKDWEIIEVTAEAAHSLGCNTLCLEPGVVIIGAEHKRLIKEIEKRKVQVVAVPLTNPRSLAAASAARPTRCSEKPESPIRSSTSCKSVRPGTLRFRPSAEFDCAKRCLDAFYQMGRCRDLRDRDVRLTSTSAVGTEDRSCLDGVRGQGSL